VDANRDCLTAAAIGAQLHRLVPAVHAAARPEAGPLVADAQPHVGFLVELRTLLLHGTAPMPVVRAIHRYHPAVDDAAAALTAAGWLSAQGNALTATGRCRDLLVTVTAVLDRTCERLWGAPAAVLDTALALVTAARGTSAGATFDPLVAAGHPTASMAGRLFSALNALRYHRADAHATAWAAEGLTADEVRALAGDHPRRRRIEAATDRVAALAYRPLAPAERAAFLAGLRELPPHTYASRPVSPGAVDRS
jgi:hypothetical protein